MKRALFPICLLLFCVATPANAQWTGWLNRDTPGNTGDHETLSDFINTHDICADPVAIECRTRANQVSWEDTGEVYSCTPERGGVCINTDQPDRRCLDYEVRFLCSPGLAKACCCGANEIFVAKDWPNFNWALRQTGHLVRMWWDQGPHEERLVFDQNGERPVAGTLRQDPFGHGAVLVTDKGNIVRIIDSGNGWTTELVEAPAVQRLGGALPCTLTTTSNGNFPGIWAVTSHFISRFWRDNGSWRHNVVDIKGHATSIVPSSIHEIFDGRIAGVLKNGQRWGIWFENNDPKEMRFDYGDGGPVAVSRTDCQ